MKRLVLFLLSLSVLLACDGLGQQGTEAVIALDSDQQTELTLSHEANEFVVSFTSSLDWTCDIEYSDDSYDWASVNKSSGTGGYAIAKVKVSVQPNDTGSARSARLIITSSTISTEILFTQESSETAGSGPSLVYMLTDGSADLDAEGGILGVVVQDGLNYQCSVEVDWILMVDYVPGDEAMYVFEVSENKDTQARSAEISFYLNDISTPFVITQAPSAGGDKPDDPQDPENPGKPQEPDDSEDPGSPDDSGNPEDPSGSEPWSDGNEGIVPGDDIKL